MAVVKHLDMLHHGVVGFGLMLEAPMVNQLIFQRTEEDFHRRIMVAIVFATHA